MRSRVAGAAAGGASSRVGSAPPAIECCGRPGLILLVLLVLLSLDSITPVVYMRPASVAAVGAPRTLVPSVPLPSGVSTLYPRPRAAHPDVFGLAVTRIYITFIGAHMNLWYRTSLRTLVLQHCHVPGVRVLVWANELPDAFLEEHFGDLLGGSGAPPRIVLVRYNATELAWGVPGASDSISALLEEQGGDAAAQPFMEPQVRMAHITDVVRMVALWRWGGVYLDADILPLKPVHDLGVAFAANLGNYECADGEDIVLPPSVGGGTVSCMCVCFMSFPHPHHALIEETLLRGLTAFRVRNMPYGGFGAWVFMDALRALVASHPDTFDAHPVSVTTAICWPSVMDAVTPQTDEEVAAILATCTTVHMMGGGHAKKFGATNITDETLFGQVYLRLQPSIPRPESCFSVGPSGEAIAVGEVVAPAALASVVLPLPPRP